MIFGIVTTLSLKAQLKTEGKKAGAIAYAVPNSFTLTRSGDIFLHSSYDRRRIQRDDDFHSSSGMSNPASSHRSGSFHTSHSSSGRSFSSTGGRKL